MESTSDVIECKKLLDELEITEQVKDADIFRRLSRLLEHLPTQVAPRQQKDLDQCLVKSHEVLASLFSKFDVSDKSLLRSFLELLLAYGYMRMSQVMYHIESPRDELFTDHIRCPEITKTKWYDLTALLPAPSEESCLNWKHLLIHTLVMDESKLFRTSFKLLIQKLHFHAILLSLGRYSNSYAEITRSGQNVAEKIGEKIIDFVHDDGELISINSFLFNLMMTFTNIQQQSSMVGAVVLARFKAQIIENPDLKNSRGLVKLDDLICGYLIDNADLQEILIVKLIEQLKCNIIRRKRRHSVEANGENVGRTLEDCLQDIINGCDSTEVISEVVQLKISSKAIQKTYLNEWVEFILKILQKSSLTPRSSSLLMQASSLILISVSNVIDDDLNRKISTLLALILESTGQRWSQAFFKFCGTEFLIELTKALSIKSELLDYYDTPMQQFYSSYIAKYLRLGVVIKNQQNIEKFANFVNFICDNTMGKDRSHLFQHFVLRELASIIDDTAKRCNKSLNQYLDHYRALSKRMYKFIRRNLVTKVDDDNNEEGSSAKQMPNQNGQANHDNGYVQAVALDSLVCILEIAVDRKEQDILDTYGESMIKLYSLVLLRMADLVTNIRGGLRCNWISIDSHLPRLVSLYVNNRLVIEPYLCYDLGKKMIDLLLGVKDLNDAERMNAKLKKKDIYNDIKAKIDAVQTRGQESDLVYQTLINRQHNSRLDQTSIQEDSIKHEGMCCGSYMDHNRVMGEFARILFTGCDHKLYSDALERAVTELEQCHALDHANVLYAFLMIESLIPRSSNNELETNLFKGFMPRISCCLLSVSKLVELGPSIHLFANAGSHRSVGAIQSCTYSNCIKIFTFMLRRYSTTLADQILTDAMQVCVASNLTRYAKYSSRLHRLFIQLSSSIASLLKSICIGRKQGDTLKSIMPAFLSVLTTLVRCVILASDRHKLGELSSLQTNGHQDSIHSDDVTEKLERDKRFNEAIVSKIYDVHLEHIAHDIGRLMNNLSFLEVKLIDFAPHVISTYIKDTQRASCPDFVKKHLDEGVYRIFNLIDAYQKERHEEVIEAGIQRKTAAGRARGSLFDMIHARLDQASREIFRAMYDNYNRFHRYQGKC